MSQPSTKRKSESTHRLERIAQMQQHGIFITSSVVPQPASADACSKLFEGDRKPASFPVYPADQVNQVLALAQNENEAIIQRDVMPLVVPSARNLHLCGERGLNMIGETLSVEWTRCASMGSTRPKPDFVAGLSRSAFSLAEFEALQNYASPEQPFQFTPALCLPFLICEAKSGEEGINKADRQNLHSASISVRAILKLALAAFGKNSPRVTELYGQVLVFTISHNHDQVHVYGHYATVAADINPFNQHGNATTNTSDDNACDPPLEYHRYYLGVWSLTALQGRNRYTPYNFVRNVYDHFVPQHLQRVKDFAQQLSCDLRPRTSALFAASALSLENESQLESPV